MKKSAALSVAALALTVLSTTGLAADPAAVAPLGQVLSDGLSVDGLQVPSGTTLLSPTVVATGNEPGYLRLGRNHGVLLGERTRAMLESTPSGGIQVAVRAGKASIQPEYGEAVLLAENSSHLLQDQEGQIQEGEQVQQPPPSGGVDDEVVLCELQDATQELVEACHADPQDSDCDWDRIEIDVDELPGFLILYKDEPPGELGNRRAAVYADNDLGVRCGRPLGLVLPIGGSLAGAAVLGLAIGDDPPVSPFSP